MAVPKEALVEILEQLQGKELLMQMKQLNKQKVRTKKFVIKRKYYVGFY